jgi:uncharacterized protein (TIGR03663 family)
MAVAQHEHRRSALLDRAIDLSRVNMDVVAFVGLVLLSVLTHLYALDRMALHHDESIHAWMSWKFFTGNGGFTCAGGRSSATYCYDPVYHGPSLYVMTLVSYFLFGDGDWQARIPQALTGIGLVASCWMLRPYLGARGALLAGVLLAFTPSLLYYTRFARHDGLMVLWTLWIVIGFFRYLDTGRPAFLYLMAAGTALAIATHELYYILAFIFGWFLIIRVLFELLPRRQVVAGLGVVLGIALLVELSIIVGAWSGQISSTLRADGLAVLFMAVAGMGLLLTRVWDNHPLVVGRFRALWRDERPVVWTALGILAAIYVVLYSTFFADPRGIIDGLYRGLEYWLGSQQEFKRGDQPWYYYFMLMTLYEPLALFGGLATLVYLFSRGWGRGARGWEMAAEAPVHEIDSDEERPASGDHPADDRQAPADGESLAGPSYAAEAGNGANGEGVRAEVPVLAGVRDAGAEETAEESESRAALVTERLAAEPAAVETTEAAPAASVAVPSTFVVVTMFPLFLTFWFLCAFVTFSWAGEKMPWLNTHIALPGNLLIAWGLSRLLELRLTGSGDSRRVPPEAGLDGAAESVDRLPGGGRPAYVWVIPFAFTLLLVAVGVALWRFGVSGADQQGQADRLQGLVPLAVAGLLLYTILTIGQRIGARATVGLCALTLAAITGAYTLRATWMVVYDHPDTPRDPLVYVQSSPDVPLIVRQIRELAVNQTRNQRNPGDPIGGLSMPVIMDNGDAAADGEGSLAWPYQWYLRDFQRLEVRGAEFFREATPDSFLVNAPREGEDQIIAPVVLVSRQHVNETARAALEANYVRRYEAKLNWWFPEGNKCEPGSGGYKRFYFAYPGSADAAARSCPGLDTATIPNMLAPLLWPLDTSHWGNTGSFLLHRELPEPLRLDGREMEVWIRRDLSPTGEASTGGGASGPVKLVAQQAVGERGGLPGQIEEPRGVAVDAQGNIYVADTGNHRITVYAPTGEPLRTIGSYGSGEGQFNEPRGVAVDAQGNIYVADTWNARVVKLDSEGNFLASWGEGTEDFGEGRRATVTDGTEAGNAAAPLGFFGPRGIAVDAAGNVYLADTGNKRIVVTDTDGNFRYQWGYAGSQAGAFSEPIGVAVDAAGTVYVGDTWNSRIQAFPPSGDGRVSAQPSLTWRVPGWQAQTYDDPYIAVVGDRVVASVPGRNQLIYFDPFGQELLRWGGAGQDLASLNLPSGLAGGPEGAVYTVDRGNARVLRFALPQLEAPRRTDVE